MLPIKDNANIHYRNQLPLNMGFTDKQMLEAIEKNTYVNDCFSKIQNACKDLKSNTACPDDDVDRLLEFIIGNWQ